MVEVEPGMGCRPSKHARSRIRAAEAWGVPSSSSQGGGGGGAGANSFSNGGAKARFPATATSSHCRAATSTGTSARDFTEAPVYPATTANFTTAAGGGSAAAQCYWRRQARPEAGSQGHYSHQQHHSDQQHQHQRAAAAEFTEFSTTTATYRRPGAGTARITVRLSKDGSTLEIEECELDSGDPCDDGNRVGESGVLSPSSSSSSSSRPIRRSASSPAVCVTAAPPSSSSSTRQTFEECCGRDKKLPSRPRTEIFLEEKNCHKPKSNTADDVLGIISLSELEMFACECGQSCENGRTACRSSMPNQQQRMGNVIVHKTPKEACSPTLSPVVVQGECEVHASYYARKESRDVTSEDDVTSVDKQTLIENCTTTSSSAEKLEDEMEGHSLGHADTRGAEDGSSAAGPSSSQSARELMMEVDTSDGAAATNGSNPPLQRMASTEAFSGSRTNVRRRPVNNCNRAALPANTEKRVRSTVNGPPPHDLHSATALNSDPGIGMEEGDSCESLTVNLQDLIAEVTYVHEDFINDFDDLFDDDITGVFSR